MVKKILCGLSFDEVNDLTVHLGYTARHALAISHGLYKKRISNISVMPKIPLLLKKELQNIADSGIYQPVESVVSTDKSVKYLFRTKTGKVFETVFIPDGKRNTVCVSTQSGCRMGCSFCVTAKYGFHGNLDAGEIINQIISIPEAARITHVVFMGMGEPLDNLDNVLKACSIITAEWGLSFSPRNVTVSTVGIMPAVENFLGSSDCNLTLSLFSPFSEEREINIPAERKYPATSIIDEMKKHPARKKRRLSLAYIMIRDFNDTESHLEALKSILSGSKIRVNLLPYHVISDDKNCSTSPDKMLSFKYNLIMSGISASIRKSRGEDISAACGLLASGFNNGGLQGNKFINQLEH